MTSEWHIRKALPGDAAGLQASMKSAYAGYEERMAGVRLPPMGLDYASEIKDFPTWIAESDGMIAGGLTMIFKDAKASIANIGVRPDCQGQGIGGGLMHFAEEQARERGHSELHLATHILLTENVSLYIHLGWSEIERDERRVKMRKSI
jgi:N-acetylglutamate synthase-like GNAT family acetyltransferase